MHCAFVPGKGKMQTVFLKLDTTGDGLVTWEEFSSCLHDEDSVNSMTPWTYKLE